MCKLPAWKSDDIPATKNPGNLATVNAGPTLLGATIATCEMIRDRSRNNKYWIPTDFNINSVARIIFHFALLEQLRKFLSSSRSFLPFCLHLFFSSLSLFLSLLASPNPVTWSSRSLVKFLRPAVFATSNVRGQAEAGSVSSFRIAWNLWGSAYRYTFIEHVDTFNLIFEAMVSPDEGSSTTLYGLPRYLFVVQDAAIDADRFRIRNPRIIRVTNPQEKRGGVISKGWFRIYWDSAISIGNVVEYVNFATVYELDS